MAKKQKLSTGESELNESTGQSGSVDENSNENHYTPTERPAIRHKSGSGLDVNSDTDRLSDPENLQDKREEDTFPASDAPSTTPPSMGSAGSTSSNERLYGETSGDSAADTLVDSSRDSAKDSTQMNSTPMSSTLSSDGSASDSSHDPSGLPANFKDDAAAQFEYGRKSQASTLHFDTSTERLRSGNPDIGDVDLGIIDANQPSQPDDNDHYDTPENPDGNRKTDF